MYPLLFSFYQATSPLSFYFFRVITRAMNWVKEMLCSSQIEFLLPCAYTDLFFWTGGVRSLRSFWHSGFHSIYWKTCASWSPLLSPLLFSLKPTKPFLNSYLSRISRIENLLCSVCNHPNQGTSFCPDPLQTLYTAHYLVATYLQPLVQAWERASASGAPWSSVTLTTWGRIALTAMTKRTVNAWSLYLSISRKRTSSGIRTYSPCNLVANSLGSHPTTVGARKNIIINYELD